MTKIRIVGIVSAWNLARDMMEWKVKYQYVNGKGTTYAAYIFKSEAVDELAAYKQFVNNLGKRVGKVEVVIDEKDTHSGY